MKHVVIDQTHEIQNTSLVKYFEDIFQEFEAYIIKIEQEKKEHPENFIITKTNKATKKKEKCCINNLTKLKELKDYVFSHIEELSSVVKISKIDHNRIFINTLDFEKNIYYSFSNVKDLNKIFNGFKRLENKVHFTTNHKNEEPIGKEFIFT